MQAGFSSPIGPEARSKLQLGIAGGRARVEELASGKATITHANAAREGLSERSGRMTLSLAFLAPELVKAAVGGRLARDTVVMNFAGLSFAWTKHRHRHGAVARQLLNACRSCLAYSETKRVG